MDDNSGIFVKAAELADDIKKSCIYTNYRAALHKLRDDPKAIEKIAFFKKENIAYRTKILQKINTNFDDEKYISSLYSELMLNAVCSEFLDAESKLLDLLTGTLDAISNGVEIEFEIFE